ncbi:MAG TPA: nicotinamide riboside transporter PnuC [Thermoanaerobaculia bacterium]|nr:nicotinamide riboside transporter PnuC [Thermoanaerobaculia bacterium]
MTISGIELAAAIISAVSIWLATKENIWYYPTGLVGLVLYTWTFYEAKLYAETILQIVCFVLMVYGWYEWLHGGANRQELAVTKTPRWAWIAGGVAGVIGSIITIALQLRFTDNPAPYVDSSLMVWSLVAQWMTARKWLENWLMWVVINTVSIPLYVTRHLWPTVILYIALWILALLGYRDWRRTLVPSSASA